VVACRQLQRFNGAGWDDAKQGGESAVIPGQPQRVGALRRPITGAGRNPESRDDQLEIPGSR